LAYSEFTLETIERQLAVTTQKTDLFSSLPAIVVPDWLPWQFNEAAGRKTAPVYDCVTSGETWQFLQLAGPTALLDRPRYYLDNVAGILGVLHAIFEDAMKVA
jgi:hypothetical protein